MAYQGSILSAMSVTLVMLLRLTLSVSEAVVCPSYPVDPTWKNSMSADELQMNKQSKRFELRWSGTFKQGAKVLILKQDTVVPNAIQAVKMAVTRARPSNSRGVYDVGIVLTLGFRPPYDEGMLKGGGGGGGGGGASHEVKIVGNGNFDEATGELCALACISDICDYKLSLKYPKPKTIRENFIKGNLTSLRGVTEKTYFDRITIHAVPDVPFEYTMNATLASVCPTLAPDVVEGKLWSKDEDVDQDCFPGLRGLLFVPSQVHWNPECEGTNCSPFAELGVSAAGTTFLRVERFSCLGDQLQVNLLFSKTEYFYPPQLTDPSTSDGTLLAEGVWDNETKQLCMIACHLYGKQDCEIAITWQFPLTFTATQRSAVVGHIQSLRREADPTYFKPITFKSVAKRHTQGIAQDDFGDAIQSNNQLEYVYTKVEAAKAECAKLTEENPKKSRGTYPSGENWQDMEFVVLKDLPSSAETRMSFQTAQFLSIFTRGKEFVERTFHQLQHRGANVTGVGVTGSTVQNQSQDGITNVSYTMNYDIGPAKQYRDDEPFVSTLNRIAGEGIYDSNTGKLCLIGCRALEQQQRLDCEMFFAIQVPRTGSSDTLTGTLKSLRRPTDPLYFKPESFSGFENQVANSRWRVNLEIVLSILMLSLTVVFLLHQVRHSKRHPETLPYISMSTLLLLSLAHMLPLVIDFEALFQPTTMYESVGRELNKVVIRVITMAAMLLQLRLLQLVWKSRIEPARVVTVQERQLLYYILPLYLAGGVISILVLEFKYYESGSGKGGVVWRDVQALGGLVLDLHLLPQVVANIVWDVSGEQAALSKPFYVGMAMVRSVPHVYDLCRRLRFVPLMADVYVYADPEWEWFSVGSDVVVPCLVMVLAIVAFLQQRWGGRCVLPRRWRALLPEHPQYQKVDRLPTDCAL